MTEIDSRSVNTGVTADMRSQVLGPGSPPCGGKAPPQAGMSRVDPRSTNCLSAGRSSSTVGCGSISTSCTGTQQNRAQPVAVPDRSLVQQHRTLTEVKMT